MICVMGVKETRRMACTEVVSNTYEIVCADTVSAGLKVEYKKIVTRLTIKVINSHGYEKIINDHEYKKNQSKS